MMAENPIEDLISTTTMAENSREDLILTTTMAENPREDLISTTEQHEDGAVFAPMAGEVVSIFVKDGGAVRKEQPMCILQSIDISDDDDPDHPRYATQVVYSHLNGEAALVLVHKGMTVEKGQIIFILFDPTTQVLPTSYKPEISDIRSMLDETTQEDFNAASPVATLGDPDVMKRYKSFNKFEIVLDYSDHLFSGDTLPTKHQLPNDWAENIMKEWKSLEEGLPDTIFVRAYESRMDLLRAVIIGLEGTPCHNGLFFFDVCLPEGYPHKPPLLRYHSGGLQIHPSLSKEGVRLMLPATDGLEEMWVPGTSTLLQLLVSIQNRILCTDPLLGSVVASKKNSVYAPRVPVLYRENLFLKSLKTMEYIMNNPPKNFEDFVVGHFRNHVNDILMACIKEASKETRSVRLKHYLNLCIKPLVIAFSKIGAKEAQDFPPLS